MQCTKVTIIAALQLYLKYVSAQAVSTGNGVIFGVLFLQDSLERTLGKLRNKTNISTC